MGVSDATLLEFATVNDGAAGTGSKLKKQAILGEYFRGLSEDDLRLAVRLEPHYADAHYNLAFVCDRLGAYPEAREHWQRYIELDPTSPWCDYAHERLAARKPLD